MKPFNQIKKLLVVAVGGGNDSISCLWLLKQLQRSGLKPAHVDILGMLPGWVQYTGVEATQLPHLGIITPQVSRSIKGIPVSRIPEAGLAEHQRRFSISNLYGAFINQGSIGLQESISALFNQQHYDHILAVDVGGDFIANRENKWVLSPMMDAYAAYAFQNLQALGYPVSGAVFGLGFDGESTPELVRKTLVQVQPSYEFEFDAEPLAEISEFYTTVVRPGRRSQTGDIMVDMLNQRIAPQYKVKRPFHVQTMKGLVKFFGDNDFTVDVKLANKGYLFDDFNRIDNRFIQACHGELEWVRKVQDSVWRYNHELCGQEMTKVYIGTPSWMFAGQMDEILSTIKQSVADGIYASVWTHPMDSEKFK